MTEQVIDTSVAIKWVVKGEPFRKQARRLLRDAHLGGIRLIGPPLLEYEVESVLQRRLQAGSVSRVAVDASLNAFFLCRRHTNCDSPRFGTPCPSVSTRI